MSKSATTVPPLAGALSIQREGRALPLSATMTLLAAIAEAGSISQAARRAGISYKTAWDRIDALNNLGAQPLVVRAAGGSQGGGTRLTPYGHELLAAFQQAQRIHDQFIRELSERLEHTAALDDLMGAFSVRTTARNHYRGVISAIKHGSVNAEVTLRLSNGIELTAIVTADSVAELGLQEGLRAFALVKSSSVLVSDDAHIRLSARNRLCGRIARIHGGAVNSDVIIDLGQGITISAMVTNESVQTLALREGEPACALFKASSVILGLDG